MKMERLHDLFLEELKDIYDAENRIVKALPKMAREAASEELSAAFEEHLSQTREHVARLTRVFEMLGESLDKKTCKAMVGLLEEGEEMMKEDAPESVKDAGLIAAAQKVEHYEMASYGCLRDWARLLDMNEAADVLQETLDEEEETDKSLTEIAQALNVEAVDGEYEEEEKDVVDGGTEEISHRPGQRPAGVARRSAGGPSAQGRTQPKVKSRVR